MFDSGWVVLKVPSNSRGSISFKNYSRLESHRNVDVMKNFVVLCLTNGLKGDR